MTKSAIFIGATGQNVGKTTLCLGILAALRKRFDTVGFIKPMGQQHVKIDDNLIVDKDVVLFKNHFFLRDAWEDMSPVMVPAGFTRSYIEGKISEEAILQKIDSAYRKITQENSYTLVEGTGHIGVGSIVNMNNARVASQLGLDMIIIVSGGLGSAHDELALNIAMCQSYGVKVRGVILNRVLEDKREMILDYFPKTLKKWKIPLIGCVPFNSLLSNPSVKDFESLFHATLLSGEKHRYRHFQSTRLVACSYEAFIEEMAPNELIITPASRDDIIQATLNKHQETANADGSDYGGGMILTSRQPPGKQILDQIRKVDLPVLYAPLCSYDAMKMITTHKAKISSEDVLKVEKAISLVEQSLDLDLLCQSPKLV